MISSIFGKTKPINLIIVNTFLFLLYWVVHLYLFDNNYAIVEFIVQLILLGTLILCVLTTDFILKKNKVTRASSFGILFFGLLVFVFPEALMDGNAILCSFLLLLAMRRLISIRSLKDTKSKIFDASLWIVIASLCYEWAALFLLLIFIAIYIYEPKNIKNWLVPFAAVFTVFMIVYCILILANNTGFIVSHYQYDTDYSTLPILDWNNNIKLITYIGVMLLIASLAFLKWNKVSLGQNVTMRLIGASFVIGLMVTLLTYGEGSYPIMITFFPAAVFITTYVETLEKRNIKEIVLIASILIPFIVFITTLATK